MDGPHSDIKLKGKADLAEARVHVPDPVLETFRIKCAHVPGEDEMDEIANRFALFFWARMQLKHPRPEAGAVPAPVPVKGTGMAPAYGNYNVVALAPVQNPAVSPARRFLAQWLYFDRSRHRLSRARRHGRRIVRRL